MVPNGRRARNPLTDEEIIVRDLLNKSVESSRLRILTALAERSRPVSQSEIADAAELSRPTVSNHLTVFRDRGWVNVHDGGIEITAGGVLLVTVIEDFLQTNTVDELSLLTQSEHPMHILQELGERPRRVSVLESSVASNPSRSTINRVLKSCAEFGWTRETDGHAVTSAGKRVIERYDRLERSVAQLVAKSPWLLRLPLEVATFPIETLSDADLVVSNPRKPSSVLWAALTLYDRQISDFRGLCSIYHPLLFTMYRPIVDISVENEMEVILDRPTYVKVAESHLSQFVLGAVYDYENYQILALDRPHTLGIGLYDDRKAAIGAYNERGDGKHIAMVSTSNDRFVEWAIELYESYRDEARPVSEL